MIRAGAIGDVLLLRQLLGRLRAAGNEVTLVAPGPVGRLLSTRHPREVDRLVGWDDVAVGALFADHPTPTLLDGCDACVSISRSADLAASLERAGVRHVALDPAPRGVHASEWYAAAASRLGCGSPATLSPLDANDDERAAARGLLDELPARFTAIHPGAGSRGKAWPLERFARVAADSGSTCLWLKGPAERDLGPPEGTPAVVADDLPLGVVLALLRRAAAYLGNDSGISHLAAAAGVPSVVLFGPTDPVLWRPVGDDVRVLRGAAGAIANTQVEEVMEALTSLRPT